MFSFRAQRNMIRMVYIKQQCEKCVKIPKPKTKMRDASQRVDCIWRMSDDS